MIAAGVAAASLVPAVSAPLHVVITPAAQAASGAASTFAAAEDGTNRGSETHGAAKTGGNSSTAVPATETATAGAPNDGTATAATVSRGSSTTTSPTTRPASGSGRGGNSGPGGGENSDPEKIDITSPASTVPATTPPVTTPPTTVPPPTTTTTTPHTPVAVNDSVTAHLNIKLTINVLANDSDADGNLAPSTLTVTGRSAGAAGDTITVRSNGRIDFTGPALVMGATWFDYRICDTTNRCATARVTVNLVSP